MIRLKFGKNIFDKNTREAMCFSQCFTVRTLISFIIEGDNINHIVWTGSAGFSTLKSQFFSFIINKCLVGRYFETLCISLLSVTIMTYLRLGIYKKKKERERFI